MSAEKIGMLLLSDTHIGFDHPLPSQTNKNRRRGPDFFNNFKLIIDQAIVRKVDYVIHCGDVFEKSNVPAFLVDQTYEQLLRLANAHIKVLIVPGNHERSALPPSLFLNHPNIHVFGAPSTYSFSGISFSGFPYVKGEIRRLFPRLKKQLESQIHAQDFNILCVHHAIDGVKAGYNNFEFRNRKDTLSLQDLPGKFDLILSGHIHKHQIMYAQSAPNNSVPIIYSGSTERTMFDEMFETKGYHTLDISGKTFEHQFHSIPARQMHRIDLRNEVIERKNLEKHLNKKMTSFEKDAIVQIISNDEEVLYQLSNLKTQGFFPDTMNITISGFSAIHRQKNY